MRLWKALEMLSLETIGTVPGTICMSLEQCVCLWSYWNSCPTLAGWHEKSRLDESRHGWPLPPASMFTNANRGRSWFLSQFRHRRRDVGATPPTPTSTSHPRGVWKRAVAWFQPPEKGWRPSAPCYRGLMVRRVPPLSECRHRTRPKTPAPPTSPRPRPQIWNLLRHPTIWLTLKHTYPFIYRLQQSMLQPKRVSPLVPVIRPLIGNWHTACSWLGSSIKLKSGSHSWKGFQITALAV